MASRSGSRRRSRPRTARRAAERAQRKQAASAERRGRGVSPTPQGFEEAFLRRGHDGIAEALIARHNQRMQRMVDVGDMMQRIALPLMAGYLPMSLAAEELGANPGRGPFHPGTTWPDHLAWGLDSAAATVRLLLSLQPVGASVIARTQLERWASNLEFNAEASQQPGEDMTVWMDRLWRLSAGALPNGVPSVGGIYADLSELMHGRGPLMPLVWLDVVEINDGPSSDHVELLERIGDALLLGLSQVRNCLATAAAERSQDALARTVASTQLVDRARSWLPDLRALLWPLVPAFFKQPGVEHVLGATASGYRRVVEAMRDGLSPDAPTEIWPVLGFGYQRFRALTIAAWAYRHEREMFGEEFDEDGIDELATDAILAGEMAAMLAVWLRYDAANQAPAAAFAVCASGLRSAQWLWLEDDDRAMGCLRCVIEQLARARTWRTKPDRAAKIETSPRSTPRDWLEAAGWRRLTLLNRALGEFVHGSTKTDWKLARAALVALQHDDSELANHTGRTHALTVLIRLVSVECAAWVDAYGDALGEAYRSVVRIDRLRADAAAEALMNRAWELRNTPLRPAEDRGE